MKHRSADPPRVGLAHYIICSCLLNAPEQHVSKSVEQEFIDFLWHIQHGWSAGLDLIAQEEYGAVLEIWERFERSSFLDVRNEQWWGKPYFRSMIRSVLCQLFYAHAHFASHNQDPSQASTAADLLAKLVRDEPLLSAPWLGVTLGNGSAARIQDENLLQTLEFALEWLASWGLLLLSRKRRAALELDVAATSAALQAALRV